MPSPAAVTTVTAERPVMTASPQAVFEPAPAAGAWHRLQAGTGRRRTPRTEDYYDTKSQVFSALIDTIDLSQLAKLDTESAREEIRDIVNDIITIKNFAMSISEQEDLLEDICNDVLGYGPLEPLLARDDIADIMVNGAKTYIEVGGKVQEPEMRFRDNAPAPERSASASSARSAAASTNRARSATRACRTARASTSSPRRSPSTAPRSPSVSSRRTS
jgi:pilus assembly protein CpaF